MVSRKRFDLAHSVSITEFPSSVELMGAMTWPIDVAEELRDAKILDELKKSTDYTSLISAQLDYKATILRTGALASIFQVMSPSLLKTRRFV